MTKRAIVFAYVTILGLCCAAVGSRPVSAAQIANSNLSSIGNARKYVEKTQPGYITYIKGAKILYKPGATGNWTTLTDSTNVTKDNRSGYSDEDKDCVTISSTTYLFKTTFRSNTGNGCGAHAAHNYQLNFKGGRVLVNPPDDLPVAIWITDIDSANSGWQKISFTDSAIKHVYTPTSGAKFSYSNGTFSTNGNGTCNSSTNPTCNAIILLLTNNTSLHDGFNVKVSMRSEDGLMRIDNNITRYYQTLTFHPDGGSVTDNGGDGAFWLHASGTNALREYAKGETADHFPTPYKAGYSFQGWYTSTGTIPYSRWQSMDTDVDLYAHWTQDPSAYALAPHVNAPVDTVMGGGSVTFTPTITKDNSNDSNPTKWKFCRLLVSPGVATPAAGSVCGDSASTVVESKNGDVFKGSGPFAVGNPVNYVYNVPIGAPYGSQICYALSVDSSTQEAGHPAESVKCVTVAKSPRLQVWGNDTRVGSSFLGWDDNNMSLISTNSGSWGEYGVIAPGAITRFGSGSVAGGTSLTFANESALGGFTQEASLEDLGVLPDVKSYLEKAGNAEYRAKTGITLVDAPATIGAYAANTVYMSSGTVTIDGDIINSSKGDNLSQMVIIASDINILPNVKQVDAWLIATNTVNTCWLNGDVPKIGNCGDDTDASTLHINGPIMAKSLLLNRTGGSDTDDNSAAEVINLRGDAYIWMHKLSGETGSIRTVYTRELAPRY